MKKNTDIFKRIWLSIGTEFGYIGTEISMAEFKIKVKQTIKEIIIGYAEINDEMNLVDERTNEEFKQLRFREGKIRIIKERLFLNKDYKTGKRGFLATYL